MRTSFTALALWAVLHLLGCADMRYAVPSGPCAVENSIECQVERSSKVPN